MAQIYELILIYVLRFSKYRKLKGFVKPDIYYQEKIFAPVEVAEPAGDAFMGLRYTKDGKKWDFETATATLLVNGEALRSVKIESFPPSGLSYLHLQTTAESYDPYGTYFWYFQKD